MNLRSHAAAVLVATVAFAGGPIRAADPAFAIPVILSLTGSASSLGSDEAEGLRLLADSVNKSGGVRGRPIAFEVQDDQSSAQVALQLASAIIAKQHPSIIIATTLVAGCSAILPLVVANGPVTYCLSAGMYPPKGSYMFAQGVPTKEALRLQIKFYHDRGWKRLAAIFTNDATGQDFERNLDAALALPENRDETLVAREGFGATEVSVNAQISSIKAAAPQAMIAWATGAPFGTVLHGMLDLGLDIPIGTTGGNLNYETMRRFNSILPSNLYFINVPGVAPDALPAGPIHSAAAAYFNTLKAAGVQPDAARLIGWDPGTIIVNSLKAVGFNATAAQHRQYIENLHDYFGASGKYDFRDGSQRGLDGSSDIVLRYDTGKQQFVAVERIGSYFSSK